MSNKRLEILPEILKNLESTKPLGRETSLTDPESTSARFLRNLDTACNVSGNENIIKLSLQRMAIENRDLNLSPALDILRKNKDFYPNISDNIIDYIENTSRAPSGATPPTFFALQGKLEQASRDAFLQSTDYREGSSSLNRGIGKIKFSLTSAFGNKDNLQIPSPETLEM